MNVAFSRAAKTSHAARMDFMAYSIRLEENNKYQLQSELANLYDDSLLALTEEGQSRASALQARTAELKKKVRKLMLEVYVLCQILSVATVYRCKIWSCCSPS